MGDKNKAASALRRRAEQLKKTGGKKVISGRAMQGAGGVVGVAGAAVGSPIVAGLGGALASVGVNDTNVGQKQQKRGRFLKRTDNRTQKTNKLNKARSMYD